ncbi:DUF4238 domain-containing protein [Kitasatospora herbaricolor]|uniref:DUF4238 domain-containing protein n=1 Tax=Kitasatospora herbaricolor TaxID=68217 RepID=UPI0036DD8D63
MKNRFAHLPGRPVPSTPDDLLRRLATVEPIGGPTPVRDQHMVSQAHSEPWTAVDRDGVARLQPFPIDNLQRRVRRRTPRGVAYVQNWCDFGSGTLELVWKATEDQIPDLRAAVENGVLHEHPDLVDVARSLIALCCVRTARLRDQFQQWIAPHEQQAGQVLASADPTRSQPIGRKLFRLAAEDLYRDTQWIASTAQVRVLVPERDQDEFLLTDAPALTIGHRAVPELKGKLGVPVGDAGNVFLPLTPRHMLTLADQPGVERIPAGFVRFLNNSLATTAIEYVFARPGSAIEQVLRDQWPAPRR